MKTKNKKIQAVSIFVINLVLGISMTIITAIFLSTVEWYLKVLIYGLITAFTVSCAVFVVLKKEPYYKTAFVCNVVTMIFVGTFFVLNLFGLFDGLKDLSKIKQLILDAGAYGYVIYILLQLFQVIILPAPGFIFYLAGTAIYGPVQAFWISYASVVAGSVIAFYVGRLAGKPVVYWCVGKEATEKYVNILGNKGNFLFFLMQLLPFFPDDILCMVAGLTKMKFSFFFAVMLFVRPVYIAAVCFFGTGELIPFSGWGIPVWIGIFVIFALVFLLYCKYRTKIEEKFKNITKKKS